MKLTRSLFPLVVVQTTVIALLLAVEQVFLRGTGATLAEGGGLAMLALGYIGIMYLVSMLLALWADRRTWGTTPVWGLLALEVLIAMPGLGSLAVTLTNIFDFLLFGLPTLLALGVAAACVAQILRPPQPVKKGRRG